MHWFEEKNSEAHTFFKKKAYFQKQIYQQQNDLKRIIFRKSWKVFRFTQIALEVDRCCQRLLSNISLLSKITQQYLFNALQNVIYHLKGRGSRQNTSQPEYQTRVGRVMGEKFGGRFRIVMPLSTLHSGQIAWNAFVHITKANKASMPQTLGNQICLNNLQNL